MKNLFLYLVKQDGLFNFTLAGLTPFAWLIRGAGTLPWREIRNESEAVLPDGADAVAILYEDTPLVTAAHLLDLLRDMQKRGVDGYEIGGGSLRTAQAFKRGVIPKRRCVAPFAERLTTLTRGKIEKILYRKIAESSVQNGAIIPDVESVRIDALSRVERGAIVEPYAVVTRSVVQSGATIGSFSEVRDAEIGAGAEIFRSVVRDSVVGKDATVGPFAYVRMGSVIGEKVRVGDFVEVKKSTLGAGTKAAHLAYIGDAAIGKRVNVGCGTVFANYDGKTKHQTEVGDDVFLGANSNLVAPLTVGSGAYVAAATTLTEEVPAGAFVIGRSRQEIKQKRRE